MNTRTARQLGIGSGYEAGILGDFTTAELASKDAFLGVCAGICEHKRQYADSPTYDFVGKPNAEGLFDAFDQGEAVGARRAWRERRRRVRQPHH